MRNAINCSKYTYSPIDFYMNLPFDEYVEWLRRVAEIAEAEKKAIEEAKEGGA